MPPRAPTNEITAPDGPAPDGPAPGDPIKRRRDPMGVPDPHPIDDPPPSDPGKTTLGSIDLEIERLIKIVETPQRH